LPGGILKSSSLVAASSIANFRLVTLAGGPPFTFPVLQISAVHLLAKVRITLLTLTLNVNNVNR
jgi:hypothetical protein